MVNERYSPIGRNIEEKIVTCRITVDDPRTNPFLFGPLVESAAVQPILDHPQTLDEL